MRQLTKVHLRREGTSIPECRERGMNFRGWKLTDDPKLVTCLKCKDKLSTFFLTLENT